MPADAFLEYVSGPDRGRRVPLERKETVVGRGAEADVRVDDPTRAISGRHAAVVRRKDAFELRDESRNGTWWRAPGKRSEPVRLEGAPHRLADGDVILLPGEVKLRFHCEGTSGEASAERQRLVLAFTAMVVVLGALLFAIESGRSAPGDEPVSLERLWRDLSVSEARQELMRERVSAAAWSERRGDEARAREEWARVLVMCRDFDVARSGLAAHAQGRLAALAE